LNVKVYFLAVDSHCEGENNEKFLREDAVSGNYWFDSIKPGEIVLARCDMTKLGN